MLKTIAQRVGCGKEKTLIILEVFTSPEFIGPNLSLQWLE